jgi:hypothetical protein
MVMQRRIPEAPAGVAALRAEPRLERRLEISAQQERDISEARQQDQRIPGAFIPVRRPH